MAIQVFDNHGNERDLAWLREWYGGFRIKPAASGSGPVYKIAALCQVQDGPWAITVKVMDEGGTPLEGVEVAYYYPGALLDDGAGPLGGVLEEMEPNRCVKFSTASDGEVTIAPGEGAVYSPAEDQIGPLAIWIRGSETRSDLILGLGMLAFTHGDHVDVDFVRLDREDKLSEETVAEAGRISTAAQATTDPADTIK